MAGVALGCGFSDPIRPIPCNAGQVSQAAVVGDTVVTTSGLRYIDGQVGGGGVVDWCRTVAVSYDAFFLDGTKFDSASALNALVFTPGVGQLIDGFEQGVIGMHVDGTRRLIVPPELAYGAEPRRDAAGNIVIPANSTIVFDVTIVQVAAQ